MNFKSIVFFVLFSTALFSQDITIVTYNILADECISSELYPNNKHIDWNFRFPRICEKIQKLNPEIICLQEVTETSFSSFQKNFSEYTGSFAKKNSSSSIGVATFCKKNTFKKILFNAILCPGTSNCGKYAVQPILIAEIITDQEKTLILINTKIKWRKNSDCHPAIKNHITCLMNVLPNMNAVIVGDFNLIPNSQHINTLCERGLVDVFRTENNPTCLANKTRQRIDYIFATSNLFIIPIPYSIISEHDVIPNDKEPSDHIPLVCQITI